MKPLIYAVAAFVLASPVVAQGAPPLPPLKTEQLRPGLHVLLGDIGNIAVLSGPDGVLIVDGLVPRGGAQIREAVAAITKEPIRYVINTHHHGDHVGGNKELTAAGAVTYAHANVRARMSAEQFMRGYNNKVPPVPEAYRPRTTFPEDASFTLNGDVVNVIHVANAHTDGDSLVHFTKANAIHMGDVFFNAMFPYIDVGAGGSVKGVIAAVDKALALGDDQAVIIPAHGSVTDKKGLVAYKAMLQDVSAKVESGIAKGMTVDAIKAGKPTAAYKLEDAEKFVEVVHDSLTYKGK